MGAGLIVLIVVGVLVLLLLASAIPEADPARPLGERDDQDQPGAARTT